MTDTNSDTHDDTETLKDVSHTPPTGEPVSAVWERGRSRDAGSESRAGATADD